MSLARQHMGGGQPDDAGSEDEDMHGRDWGAHRHAGQWRVFRPWRMSGGANAV
jgi:hypothetical protein